MDLFDFYKLIEESEVDVSQSVGNLHQHQFKRGLLKNMFQRFFRGRRRIQTRKHVETFD